MVDAAIRVFIAYAHDSEEHAADVLRLHDLLREGGVEAILDRYADDPGVQWTQWMEEQIAAADFVLVIVSPTYGRLAAPVWISRRLRVGVRGMRLGCCVTRCIRTRAGTH